MKKITNKAQFSTSRPRPRPNTPALGVIYTPINEKKNFIAHIVVLILRNA